MEDGFRAGLFSINEFNSKPHISKLINKHSKNIKIFRKEIIINQIIRELINAMVNDVIKTTNLNIKKIKPKTIYDIYNHNEFIVSFSKEMKDVDKKIKEFLKKRMYNNKKVLTNTNKGKKIIKELFKNLSKNPKKHINSEFLKREKKERVISDFIAGMTDRYAINLYKKIK